MRITSTIQLRDAVYHVAVDAADTLPFTPAEQEALTNFGEPTIACGGTFTLGDLTYTLAENDRLFPSQFPVKQTFSTEDYPDDANERATLWRNTIKTRLENAVAALRSLAPGTVGEETDNIDTTPA